jgi:hypothetical protein
MSSIIQEPTETLFSNFTILGIAGVCLTFLIKYLIATKDKNTEVIMKDIKEMKDMFYKLSTDNSLINNTLNYSKLSLDSLNLELSKLRETQINQSRIIERLTTSKTATDKQINELEKKYNELKRQK